jgi:flagellar motility protein MotE (MotC chaperone)
MAKIPPPRLLPLTIVALGALFVLKCGALIQFAVTHEMNADGGIVAAANAASTEQVKENTGPAKETGPVKENSKPAAAGPAPAGGPKAAAPEGQAASGKAPPGQAPVTESERILLQDLRQRRQDLDKRADTLAARESVLIATEEKLTARVSELQALQKKLEGLDAAQKQKEDAGWQGLVKVYETMKPKDAATIFNDLSMPVLLQLMDRMKDSKAAAVMAAMNPDKARDVTGELAQMRTGRDASGAPVAGLKDNLSGG